MEWQAAAAAHHMIPTEMWPMHLFMRAMPYVCRDGRRLCSPSRGFVHGSRTKIGNLIVGWDEADPTIVVVPTVPDLSGCGEPAYYRRSEILKAYRNKYPTDAFIIYPDRSGYIGINAYDWLDDEKLYVYVSQEEELAAFTDFFMNRFAKK